MLRDKQGLSAQTEGAMSLGYTVDSQSGENPTIACSQPSMWFRMQPAVDCLVL